MPASRTPLRASFSQSTICLFLLGVLAFTMSAQVAIAMPTLFKADERAHAAYAIALSQGTLPTIDTDIPDDPVRYPQLAASLFGQDEAHRDIWTANHPPLFYVMSVPLVWLGDAIEHPGLTLLGMRLLNALGFAISVVLVGLIAGQLVPRRRAVPVIASAMAVGCGAVTFVGGAIYNDGWATAAAFATLYLGFRMVRDGVTRDRVVWATVVGVAAASFRSTGLVAVLVLGTSVLVAMWLRDPTRRTFLRGVAVAAGIGLAPVVVIGWFYVRNMAIYGDATASAALFDKFGREPNGTALFQLVNPEFYGSLLGSLWTDGNIPNSWGQAAVVVLSLTVVGLVAEAVARRSPRPYGLLRPIVVPGGPPRPLERRTELAVRGLMGLYALFIVVSTAGFVAGGGWLHARYAIPLLPLLAAGAALAALRVGRMAPLRSRNDEVRDLRIALGACLAFMVVGLVCHLSTEQHVDGPVQSTTWLVALVAADLVMFGLAAYVATELRRRLHPAVFGLTPVAPVRVPSLAG